MENDTIQIEYKKFSSFLKDYINSFQRGFLFLVSDEEHSEGEFFSFSIKVHELGIPLSANGKVIYSGIRDTGEKGIGLEFSFDENTQIYIDKTLPEIVLQKYGNLWGNMLNSLIGENHDF